MFTGISTIHGSAARFRSAATAPTICRRVPARCPDGQLMSSPPAPLAEAPGDDADLDCNGQEPRVSEHPVELLRLVTAGSVDDGKSTLIGRLLYDSKQVLTDQLEHIEQASQRMGHDFLDLSLLTDGLRAEREQGITIDVAYRYFATAQRRFIIADTPGHEQY